MNLVNAEYNISIKLEENRAAILVIEEKGLRFKLVDELYRQCMGEEGNFVLSDNTQILKMNKTADILMNPFSVDYNSRKVLTKLYQEIEARGNESFYEEKQKINSDVLTLFDKIMLNVSYNISCKLELDLIELCKIYSIVIESEGDSLLEKLMEYMKVMSQLCSVKLFIFLNLTLYLNQEEIRTLYEFASYQKIYLLLIEYVMPREISDEIGCIIDEEGCIIEIGQNDLQHLPGVTFGENPKQFEV